MAGNVEAIESIVKRYSARIKDDRIYFAPHIPPQKLANAIAAFAPEAEREGVLALVDNSFFGSAKDGLLLTRRRIYTDEWLELTHNLKLEEIDSVAYVETSTSKQIHVNDMKFATLHIPEAASVKTFAKMLDEIRALFHPRAEEIAEAMSRVREGQCACCGAPFEIEVNRHQPACVYCGARV